MEGTERMNIKKDDKVIVLSGKDKGQRGQGPVADPKGLKVVVEGVNVATAPEAPEAGSGWRHHQGRDPIYACKVQLVCPKCGKATRVAHKITDGKKTRVCRSAAQKSEKGVSLLTRMKKKVS